MDDTDEAWVRSVCSDSVADLQQSGPADLTSGHSSSVDRLAQQHEAVVKDAMEEISHHPDQRLMAVLPSQTNSTVELINVEKLTTSDQQLVLSEAMQTEGQDNERLLTKIRERQDRCSPVAAATRQPLLA